RYAESSILNKSMHPMILALVPEEAIPPLHEELALQADLSSRRSRMIRLAARALGEVMEGFPFNPALPVFLALPENPAGHPPFDHEDFLRHVAVQADLSLDLDQSRIFPSGRAGGFQALEAAMQWLEQGKANHILCGGVDSYLDLHLLNALDQEGRVLSEGVMDGFAPGEGASFLLLGTESARNTFAEGAMAKVHAPGLASETGHRYSDAPYQGDGLAQAVCSALDPADGDLIRTVMAGFNGENLGAKEWGVAFLRNHAAFDGNYRIEHPADCFGDTGAAMGPLLIGMAAMGMQKGHLPCQALVFCASDHELRAAARVTFESKKEK
ncbi:MAG: beta-ketoacyl synthase N-terminal-like domain-containing protein, partial [Planctomycetota bacterium]